MVCRTANGNFLLTSNLAAEKHVVHFSIGQAEMQYSARVPAPLFLIRKPCIQASKETPFGNVIMPETSSS